MHSNEQYSSMNNLETPDNPQPGNKLSMQHSTQKNHWIISFDNPLNSHFLGLFSESPVNSMYSYQLHDTLNTTILKKKLRGLSPRANYTDRAAAAGRRS